MEGEGKWKMRDIGKGCDIEGETEEKRQSERDR
jgi:hypothetical protein